MKEINTNYEVLNYMQGLTRSNRTTNFSKTYSIAHNLFHSDFYSEKINIDYRLEKIAEWYDVVDSMEFKIDMSNSICPFNEIERNLEKKFNYKTLKIFEKTVNIYLEEKKTNSFFKEISINALKNFLYILPTIEKYSPVLSIESDTGYINSTFITEDYGILRALSTDKGEIHFSRVSEDIRICKISGVFKIKDSRDFKNFKIVLRML